MPTDPHPMRTSTREGERLKVLVCGSRDWTNDDQIRFALVLLAAKYGPLTVIHGAARGADQIAGSIATAEGHEVREFPADWRGKGKRAGIVRNLAMLDQEPHVVLAFQRNGSRGTQHTIDEARKRGIQTFVYEEATNAAL